MNVSAFICVIFGLMAVSGADNVLFHGVHLVEPAVDASLCGTCDTFVSNGMNQLLNTMQHGVVIDSCSGLCSKAFPTQKKEQDECDLVCDAVGEMAFVKLVQKYADDWDPIYFCELAKLCPVHEGGYAQLNSLTVQPMSGKQGTTFEIDATFTVLNQTSTGELVIQIRPPHGSPFGTSMLNEGFASGEYSVQFSLDTHPSEHETFDAGNYVVELIGCNGKCGSKWPYSLQLFEGSSNFTITHN